MTSDDSPQHVGAGRLDEPAVRLVDFSDNTVVRQVSTMLRRLWLVAPPLSDEELLQEAILRECFQAITQAIGNGISDDPEETRWDHGYWLSHTELRVLDPAALAAAEPYDVRSVVSPWRSEIYQIYKHVFIDLWRVLNETSGTSNLGPFDPTKEGSVTLGVLKAEKLKADKTAFGSDTFLYPVWINPKARITFSVDGVDDGNEHVWSDVEPAAWTKGLWSQGGKEITMTTKLDGVEDDPTGIAAVFVMGHCEKAPLIHPKEEIRDKPTTTLATADGGNGQAAGNDKPEFAPEADHLARAIFLQAGTAVVEQCAFDVVDTEIEQLEDTTSWLEVDVQESDTVYKPLPNGHSIRVLILDPGSAEASLKTRLEVVDLDKEVGYEAMSYTWGHPKDQVSLRVGGQTVFIPKNLENALRRLRYPDRRRYIWADAVCINQADLSERGQQVSIMRNIYTKARRVLVWLGQDKTNYAKLAFSTICEIVRSWRPPTNLHKFSSYKDAFEPQKNGLSVDEEGWTALQALFQTDYFTRFWVIQELVLGQKATVFWGGHSINWSLVGITAAWLLTRGWATNPDWPVSAAYNAFLIYVLPLTRRSAISSFSKLDLSAVLAATMGKFGSIDARDRIFALLGAFSGNDPEKEQLVSPDYTADVQSVYLSATKRMLSQDLNLRLLSAVQHGHEVDKTSPSWVPRWDQPPSAEPLALRQEHGYYANAGELFIPGDDTFGADVKSLTLAGIEVTTVSEATEPFTAGNISFSSQPDKLRDAVLIMLSYLNDPDRQVRSSWGATMERFAIPGFDDPEKQAKLLSSGGGFKMAATTGMPGRYGMRKSTETLDGERMGIDNLGDFLLYWRERCSWDAEALRHDDFKDFWAAVEAEGSTYATERAMCSMNTFLGRRVFRCEDGKLGLGPAAMRPGDVVVVLFGGIVPYVLRLLLDGGGDEQKWAFVGECIVPTIMQGQAVEEVGLLAKGTYERGADGMLSLKPVAQDEQDPRFHREVGKNGVKRFEIR
ncbi:hypothetical protein DHEL01_v201694 [Diaporthe helianthi]|uniref:Heterokaryon incompatibility domain-containing protein n=1 Tax=Diaporthe helianthi TaxID=158607 RepID=A0A2P5IBP0_DIAHE|nr:hypothetical protein DHEL01_v201694 [Diaporthe helianthi]